MSLLVFIAYHSLRWGQKQNIFSIYNDSRTGSVHVRILQTSKRTSELTSVTKENPLKPKKEKRETQNQTKTIMNSSTSYKPIERPLILPHSDRQKDHLMYCHQISIKLALSLEVVEQELNLAYDSQSQQIDLFDLFDP
jgi:hypothetical protein